MQAVQNLYCARCSKRLTRYHLVIELRSELVTQCLFKLMIRLALFRFGEFRRFDLMHISSKWQFVCHKLTVVKYVSVNQLTEKHIVKTSVNIEA